MVQSSKSIKSFKSGSIPEVVNTYQARSPQFRKESTRVLKDKFGVNATKNAFGKTGVPASQLKRMIKKLYQEGIVKHKARQVISDYKEKRIEDFQAEQAKTTRVQEKKQEMQDKLARRRERVKRRVRADRRRGKINEYQKERDAVRDRTQKPSPSQQEEGSKATAVSPVKEESLESPIFPEPTNPLNNPWEQPPAPQSPAVAQDNLTKGPVVDETADQEVEDMNIG